MTPAPLEIPKGPRRPFVLKVTTNRGYWRRRVAAWLLNREVRDVMGRSAMDRNGWLRTRASGWVILIRLMVGLAVFFPEGIQNLIFPELLGAGRFTRIGIPFPDLMGPFVGVVEIVCGALIVVGFLTRLAAIPLLITMVVASSRSRFRSYWAVSSGSSIYRNSTATDSGARSTRAEPILAMLLGCLYQLIEGAGRGRSTPFCPIVRH